MLAYVSLFCILYTVYRATGTNKQIDKYFAHCCLSYWMRSFHATLYYDVMWRPRVADLRGRPGGPGPPPYRNFLDPPLAANAVTLC